MSEVNTSQREELHRAIWAIADELRGSVDGWDFKNYILGTMFYRYLSETFTAKIDRDERADEDERKIDPQFSYVKLSDEQVQNMKKEYKNEIIEAMGFFLKPSELFCNVCDRADKNENLNETLDKIFKNIENSSKGTKSEKCFKGLFADFDVDSNRLGATISKRNERLAKLLFGIRDMKLGTVSDHNIDAFGDAYEYLMTMYASSAGKSGGEFYTPQEVSELLTRLGTVGKTSIKNVYDPACGSGSLLLKAKKILGESGVSDKYYGQEINITTYNLCRINMFLHGIGFENFEIACEDTLTKPQHQELARRGAELIVSNPPYSIKWVGDSNRLLTNDERYSPAGVLAPKSKADMAFIMHSLHYLASNGVAVIVCFPGIMYRGGAEQKIRKYLVNENFIDAIIQLPDNLFFGTSIATCIMIMKKNKIDNSVLFIDASKEYVKVTNNNKLTPENVDNIVKYFSDRKDVDHICRLVPCDEIANKDYNLSVSTYVEHEDVREEIDIKKLNEEINGIVSRLQLLRNEIDKIITEIES